MVALTAGAERRSNWWVSRGTDCMWASTSGGPQKERADRSPHRVSMGRKMANHNNEQTLVRNEIELSEVTLAFV